MQQQAKQGIILLTNASCALHSTLAMVKPDAFHHTGAILSAIAKAGLTVSNLRMAALGPGEAAQFYAAHEGAPYFDKVCCS